MKQIENFIKESILDDDEALDNKQVMKYKPDVQWHSNRDIPQTLKPLFNEFELFISYYINNFFDLPSYKKSEEFISELRWVIQGPSLGNIIEGIKNFCDWTLSALEYNIQEDYYETSVHLYNSKKHNNNEYLITENPDTTYCEDFIEEFNKRYANGELNEFKKLFN